MDVFDKYRYSSSSSPLQRRRYCPRSPYFSAIEGDVTLQEQEKKKKKIVVSPYFNHDYGPEFEVEIAQKKNEGKARLGDRSFENTTVGLAVNQDEQEKKKKKKKIVVSPYFNHDYGPKFEVEIAQKKNEGKARVGDKSFENTTVNQDSEKSSEKNKKIVVSPYFNHNYGQGIEVEIARKKNEGKARVASPLPLLQDGITYNRDGGKGKRKDKRKVVVVSPYFEHHNYNNDNYKVVVKEKAIKSPHFNGNPSPTTPVRFNPLLKAYRRKCNANYWIPPESIYGLLQEGYYQDPWKVLVICMFLNRTTGDQARQVIPRFFNLCPNAKAAIKVETGEIEEVIRSLGLQKKRSRMIQRFSWEYLNNEWTHVSQLHGIG
ncbi:hypothetical protein KI387_031568, partial [Taxus chinensis]